MITTPEQADAILREGKADMVLLAREFLRQPYFPLVGRPAIGAGDSVARAISCAPRRTERRRGSVVRMGVRMMPRRSVSCGRHVA